jgi:hypothetical protein
LTSAARGHWVIADIPDSGEHRVRIDLRDRFEHKLAEIGNSPMERAS